MQESVEYNGTVIARLSELGLDGAEFIEMMKKHNGIMAGSFPLQCMLHEYWRGSDIDIYFTGKDKYEQALHPFMSYLTKIYNTVNKIDDQAVSDDDNTAVQRVPYFLCNVLFSYKISINEAIVNVVFVDCDVTDFIANRFDLSFCQTYFDGDKMTLYEASKHKRGVIRHNNNIKNKQHYHKLTNEITEITERMPNRGPKGVNVFYPVDVKYFLAHRLKIRIAKYVERGFTITDEVIAEEISKLKDNIENAEEVIQKLKQEYQSTKAKYKSKICENERYLDHLNEELQSLNRQLYCNTQPS